MSSCLSGGGRTYGFELEIVKPASSSSSGRSSHTSSPSSTLSESSNSALTISLKKARSPRKRPNQAYNEAALLFSTIYPNIFSAKGPKSHLDKNTKLFPSFPEPPDLLPLLPVLNGDAFLIHQHQPDKLASSLLQLKSKMDVDKECASPPSNISWEPDSPDFDDDFDAQSILDEEVEEGIDSIMGNLSMNTPSEADDKNGEASNRDSSINPLLPILVGNRNGGGRFQLGLGLPFGRNMRCALRNRDDGDWWRSPTVPVRDLIPNLKPPAAGTLASEKKKKKKSEKQEAAVKSNASTAVTPSPEKLKAALRLKLNYDEVLRAWSTHDSIFSDGPESPTSSADVLAKLADIDLFPDAGGGREASVMRYKEKRRTRLFSKKIRYQVRKANADRRPRMKGRFVRSPSLLQQAMEEESQ